MAEVAKIATLLTSVFVLVAVLAGIAFLILGSTGKRR